jgi:glycerol-3-phosphate acyltransferase PlsY
MQSPVLQYAAALIFGYLCGSIPFGVLLTRYAGTPDLRSVGSGNIGATNVLRSGKRWAAAATLVADAGKAAAAVLITSAWFGLAPFPVIAGFGAFIGHLYPVWLLFKGGKGVASFIGIMLALDFWIGILTCVSWVITARIVKISSVAALMAAAMTPVFFAVADEYLYAALALVLAALIFYSHRANLARLRRGDEPRIGGR